MVLLRTMLVLMMLAGAAIAQDREVEQKVEGYFKALQSRDWKTMTSQFTGHAQKDFRTLFTEILDSAPAEQKPEAISAFFGESLTNEQITALSDHDFMAKVLGHLLAQVLASFQFQASQIIGSVREKPDLVHVVTRLKITGEKGLAVEKMTVTSVEREAGHWGLALTGEIKGVATALRTQISH